MAMNVRGGNGYIEAWVNAKLVRDSLLGSIWEGAENVVALDVARSAARQRAHEPLFSDLQQRLEQITDRDVRTHADLMREDLARIGARFDALLQANEVEREARMAAMCDRLAALVCGTLLLEEADAQARAGGGYRKLLVAAEYRRRFVERLDPLELSTAGVRWLDEVIDWGPVGAEAAKE
jgi:hypothetical protein